MGSGNKDSTWSISCKSSSCAVHRSRVWRNGMHLPNLLCFCQIAANVFDFEQMARIIRVFSYFVISLYSLLNNADRSLHAVSIRHSRLSFLLNRLTRHTSISDLRHPSDFSDCQSFPVTDFHPHNLRTEPPSLYRTCHSGISLAIYYTCPHQSLFHPRRLMPPNPPHLNLPS